MTIAIVNDPSSDVTRSEREAISVARSGATASNPAAVGRSGPMTLSMGIVI